MLERARGSRLVLIGSMAAAMLVGLAPRAQAGRGPQVSAPGWHLQSPPTPPGSIVSNLTGVSCSAASACLAVGSEETSTSLHTAFAERWNGSTWTLLNIPNAPKTSLNAVACLSATHCVAVGDAVPANPSDTLALAEVWNGSTWTAQTTPNPVGTTHASLTGVACRLTRCMAVGWFSRSTHREFLLAERWNGSNWALRVTPEPSGATRSRFNAVSCSATSCVALGAVSAPTSDMLAEGWNGTSWALLSSPDPSGGSQGSLQAVSCSATTACTATGYYSTGGAVVSLAERWDGTSWTQQSTPNPAGAVNTGLGGVSCPAANLCVAVGGATTQTATSDLAEIWNGSAWALDNPGQPSGAAVSSLSSVSCPSVADCTAVGSWADSSAGNLVPLAAQYF